MCREGDVLHDMRGYVAKSGLGKNGSACKIKEAGLPSHQPIPHVVQYKLEVLRGWFSIEYGKAKIFPKGSTRLNIKDLGTLFSISHLTIS